MAGRRVFSASVIPNMNNNNNNNVVLLQNQTAPATTSQPLIDSLLLSAPPPPFHLGSRSMMSFEDVQGGKGCNGSFFRTYDPEDNDDDGMGEYSFHQQPEKKRRLSAEQVQFLEKSFEEENKLEPERKTKLAKDLGLQPRQVAIWFQNRRARWKTKRLEKDYDSLQSSYDSLKASYESLLKEKDRLEAEVADLTEKVVVRERQGGKEETERNGSQEVLQKKPSVSEGEGSKVSAGACSDILDSDSPHYTDGVHSALLETGDSSYVLEPDQSDLSQDEEDNLSNSLFHPYNIFPKLEHVDYSDPPETSCNFVLIPEEEEDHHDAFWPWSF